MAYDGFGYSTIPEPSAMVAQPVSLTEQRGGDYWGPPEKPDEPESIFGDNSCGEPFLNLSFSRRLDKARHQSLYLPWGELIGGSDDV